MDIDIKMIRKKRIMYVQSSIKWWILSADNMFKMRDRVAFQKVWEISEDVNDMRSKVVDIIRSVV